MSGADLDAEILGVPAHKKVEADLAARELDVQASIDATKALAVEAQEKAAADAAITAAKADFAPVAPPAPAPALAPVAPAPVPAAARPVPSIAEYWALYDRLETLEEHFAEVVGHLAQSFGDVYAAKKAELKS